MSNSEVVDALDIAIALAVLGAICAPGFNEGRRSRAFMYTAPPLVGLWSLLTFYHLTYGFILFLPTFVLLMFAGDARTRRTRAVMVAVLQLCLVVDVPGLWRRIGQLAPHPAVLDALAPHFDRALVLVTFAAVTTLYVRRYRNRGGPPATVESYRSLESTAGPGFLP